MASDGLCGLGTVRVQWANQLTAGQGMLAKTAVTLRETIVGVAHIGEAFNLNFKLLYLSFFHPQRRQQFGMLPE